MKKEHKLIILLAIITIYIVMVPTLIIPFFSSSFLNFINPLFWITLFIVTYLFYKDIYIRSKHNRHLAKRVFYILLIYTTLFFLTGFIYGFIVSPLSHSMDSIVTNIISLVIVFLIEEYIRYYLVNSFKNKKNILILITTVFAILDIVVYYQYNFVTNFIIFALVIILPNIFISILCTYLSNKKSIYSTLLIKSLPMLIYILVPVIPRVNYFFIMIFEILLTITIFIVIRKSLNRLTNIDNKINAYKRRKIKLLILTVFSILVMFTIGMFTYVPLSIVSESMVPVINVGDAVIYEKIKDDYKFSVNEIIIFVHNDMVIVHRINSISYIDGELSIKTKGDNNNSIDDFIVEENDIIGIYKTKIPYIGYPASFIHKIIGGR